MISKNVTVSEMEQALKEVNKKYGDNVIFNNFCPISSNRIRFTLKVKDSSKAGARKGSAGHKMISACWHVHGHMFEEIFKIKEDAEIRSGSSLITNNEGNWQDRNIGSIVEPMLFSEACHC